MRKFCLFLSFIFIISCNQKGQNHNSDIEETIINVEERSCDDKTTLMSLMDDVKFIQLETHEDAFIGESGRIDIVNNRVVILDKKEGNLLLFDSNGKYIKQVSQRGRGPNEVITAFDFYVDKTNKMVFLLDAEENEILVYDTEGDIVDSFKTDFQSFMLSGLGTSSLIHYIGYFDPTYHNIFLSDYTGIVNDRMFPFPQDMFPIGFRFTGFLTKYNNDVLYQPAASNNIYQIGEECDSLLKYSIDFGSRNWISNNNHDFNGFFMKMSQFQIDYLLNEFEETSDSFVFRIRRHQKEERVYYLKNESTAYYPSYNLIPDLFYSILSSPKGKTEDGYFISILNPFVAKLAIDKELDQGKKVNMDQDLIHAIRSSDENSNNLILLYKLKKKTN